MCLQLILRELTPLIPLYATNLYEENNQLINFPLYYLRIENFLFVLKNNSSRDKLKYEDTYFFIRLIINIKKKFYLHSKLKIKIHHLIPIQFLYLHIPINIVHIQLCISRLYLHVTISCSTYDSGGIQLRL
jgi:hypothetical protein